MIPFFEKEHIVIYSQFAPINPKYSSNIANAYIGHTLLFRGTITS